MTAALLPVLGHVSVPPQAAPRVADLGDHFEAAAAGQRALYRDKARDCVERARVAAVFIGLALNPPTVPSRDTPPPPPPVVPTPGGKTWFLVGAAVRLDGDAAGSSPSQTVGIWGGELSFGAGHGHLGGALGAGVLASSVSHFNGQNPAIAVRQQRFPFSAALRFHSQLPWHLWLAAEGGASLVLVTFRAENLQMTGSALRLDAGLRAAVKLYLPPLVRHFAPFVAVHAEYFPKPYALDVVPLGTVGSSSHFWLGGTAGLVFRTF